MIRIEFFGIPRERTQVASIDVEAETIEAALKTVGERFPDFAGQCMIDGRLAAGLILNLNGDIFLSSSDRKLIDGDSLLVLSADVGG